MPNLRSLSQLRSLLPYAAKLLPVLTGIAVSETAARPDLSSLNRHFGEMQIESRGLRSRVESQGEQIERSLKHSQEQLDRLASTSRGAAASSKSLPVHFAASPDY